MESCGTSKKVTAKSPMAQGSPGATVFAPKDSPTPGAAKTSTSCSYTTDLTPQVWSACPWVSRMALTSVRFLPMLARRAAMRRRERPASTSRPPESVSIYVALPELPLERTLSRKSVLYQVGRLISGNETRLDLSMPASGSRLQVSDSDWRVMLQLDSSNELLSVLWQRGVIRTGRIAVESRYG